MYTHLFPSLLLLTTATATALPFPSWPNHHGPPHNPKPANEEPCSEAVVALATGIHLNIQGQYAEYNGTLAVLAVESSLPVDQTAFSIAKGELLSDIQGVIRPPSKTNQERPR